MTHAAIAADLHQTLDVQGDLRRRSPSTFRWWSMYSRSFARRFGQILDAGVGVDAGFRKHRSFEHPRLSTNTVDVGQADLDRRLSSGQVNTGNTCHVLNAPPVLGMASTTMPSTSIMSYFAKCYPPGLDFWLPRSGEGFTKLTVCNFLAASDLLGDPRRSRSLRAERTCLRFLRFGFRAVRLLPSAR